MTGTYDQLVEEYAKMPVADDLKPQLAIVEGLFAKYKEAVAKFTKSMNPPTPTSWHATSWKWPAT